MISGIPCNAGAITGSPHAIASRITIPKPSLMLERTKTSASPYIRAILDSSSRPGMLTKSPRPRRSSKLSSSARRSPSPIIVSRKLTPRSLTWAHAWSSRPCAFCQTSRPTLRIRSGPTLSRRGNPSNRPTSIPKGIDTTLG